MVVEFQPLLSYFLDGSALRPYRACRVHTSRVAPHFYCLLTLVWNVWLLELQHLVNFNMEAILINICICMKGTHTHKSQIIKILGKPPPSVHADEPAVALPSGRSPSGCNQHRLDCTKLACILVWELTDGKS